ncbi:hypothetical protein [Chitinimonas lacunae]|uniref:Uncharacterized protein n=1 Tax=Chitinimonas lacunae TaxID=1963018 RepID=A0ABV8MM92_9NEIS
MFGLFALGAPRLTPPPAPSTTPTPTPQLVGAACNSPQPLAGRSHAHRSSTVVAAG